MNPMAGNSFITSQHAQAHCPFCGTSTQPGQKFCRTCGSRTGQIAPTDPNQVVFCDDCGAALNKSWAFCHICGHQVQIGGSSPTPAPVVGGSQTGLLGSGRILATRYEIAVLVGQGGMGAVYKGCDTRFLKRPLVAIKELSQAGLRASELAEATKRFATEADMLRDLQHPSLPRV